MLNIGVIGCGAIGRDHIRRLTDIVPAVRLLPVQTILKKLRLRLQRSMKA